LAIGCARALGCDPGGQRAGCGIHTGEVALAGDDVAGAAVRITQSLAALARPAEILVSRTVKDLLAGSGYRFTSRGQHRLADSPDSWRLFAVGPAG